MRIILLIMIGASFLLASETVTDTDTGLTWQDNSAAKDTKRDWQGAQKYCHDLSLDGHSDWRLPYIKELQSIINISRYKPAIQKDFKNVASDYYWTSSVSVSYARNPLIVNFSSGYTYNYYNAKTNEYYVRCVRGRQAL